MLRILVLFIAVVVVVNGRPQRIVQTNDVTDDPLIQRGRKMVTKFLFRDQMLRLKKLKGQASCFKNIFKQCHTDFDCGCHIKCVTTLKGDFQINRCLPPTYPMIR